jgi:hypothetical protein
MELYLIKAMGLHLIIFRIIAIYTFFDQRSVNFLFSSLTDKKFLTAVFLCYAVCRSLPFGVSLCKTVNVAALPVALKPKRGAAQKWLLLAHDEVVFALWITDNSSLS